MEQQRGAEWKAGGELKALQRIIPPVIEDEDAALPPRLHNGPPAAVFNVAAEDIELEAQAMVVEKAIADSQQTETIASNKRIRAGKELIRLQEIFFERARTIYRKRHEKINALRGEGMTYDDIGKIVGLSGPAVIRASSNPELYLGSTQEGRKFYKWATDRFGLPRKNLYSYLCFGRRGENELKRIRIGKNKLGLRDRALVRLVKTEEQQKVTPTVFKNAFMALQPHIRKTTLLWACSTIIGSEDPQEIARWFADAFAKRA